MQRKVQRLLRHGESVEGAPLKVPSKKPFKVLSKWAFFDGGGSWKGKRLEIAPRYKMRFLINFLPTESISS